MHSTDHSKQDAEQVRVKYTTFRKYLEIQYCWRSISQEQNALNRPNHMCNYAINNSLAIIQYI